MSKSCLNELKFYEVSRNPKIKQMLKFLAVYLDKQKGSST